MLAYLPYKESGGGKGEDALTSKVQVVLQGTSRPETLQELQGTKCYPYCTQFTHLLSEAPVSYMLCS